MAPLDGKEPVKATPFDAHEQATRGEYVATTETSPDLTSVAEFPKAVDHLVKDNAPKGHLEPVIVNSPEEEKAYLDAKAAEETKDA